MLDTLIGYHHAMSKIHRAGIMDMDMVTGMVTGMVTDMVTDMDTLISHNPPIADLK
jgi:hypothetical protein